MKRYRILHKSIFILHGLHRSLSQSKETCLGTDDNLNLIVDLFLDNIEDAQDCKYWDTNSHIRMWCVCWYTGWKHKCHKDKYIIYY